GAIPTSTFFREHTARNTICIPSEPTRRKAAKAKMPTSETGTSNSRLGCACRVRTRGFTLIEIMVVIAIIGLVTTVTLLALSRNSRATQLDDEAQKLDPLFDYGREQAELQTRDYGFRVTRTGYSFVVFDVLGNQWRPVDEDDALRDRDFPPDFQPHMVVE